MRGDWIITLAPIFGLAAALGIQIAYVHLFHGRTGTSIKVGLLCGLIVSVFTAASGLGPDATRGSAVPVLAVTVLTYLALAWGYWAFLNLNITSLRVRILREILNAKTAILRTELLKRYSPDEFLRRRLERLERSGQIRKQNQRWLLTSGTLHAFARFMGVLRTLVLPARARCNKKEAEPFLYK